MSKNEVVSKIIEEQKTVIANLENSVSRYRTASDIDEHDSIDPEDFSHQEEAKDMQLRYEQMAIQAKTNLDILESYKNKNCAKLVAGALVETEDLYLFIGISTPQFILNDKNVITISEQAPIYSLLKEKVVGEKITIGKIENTILSIS
ncbi:hypothetical protein [Flavobacterium sp.]|jgi:hypothetical protein|uniref:hypothetical protein n=1 Tax=Flavobacterium sp. TaxID=239 RepID=UPI0037BFD390